MSFRGPQAITDSLTEMFRSLRKECSGPGFQKTLQPPEFPHNPNRYLHNLRRFFSVFCVLGAEGLMDQLLNNSRFGALIFAAIFIASIIMLLADQGAMR